MRALAFLAVFLFAQIASAQSLVQYPTTPDFSVSQSSPTTIDLGIWSDWIWIRNHCATSVYFHFNPDPDQSTTGDNYAIRLGQNEEFKGPFRVHSVGASPGSDATGSCNFSIVIGRF